MPVIMSTMKRMISRNVTVVPGILLAVIIAAGVLSSCATEPPPPVAGNLTAENIRTAMTDAMLVTADAMFSLLDGNGRTVSPAGVRGEEGYRLEWSDVSLEDEVGWLGLRIEQYQLKGGIFAGKYRDYVISGTISMGMNGTAGVVDMDLQLSHANPERYPVTTLELHLENLESDIDPSVVEGFVRANGYDVDPALVATALQIEING
jgi:hypothetical protein